MNLPEIVKDKKDKIKNLFDEEGIEIANTIFGRGLSPYLGSSLMDKAESINVVVRMLAEHRL
jgi:hypothetical protein